MNDEKGVEVYEGDAIIKCGKYLGDKQVYGFMDFIEGWRAWGFWESLKEWRKKEKKYYFIP